MKKEGYSLSVSPKSFTFVIVLTKQTKENMRKDTTKNLVGQPIVKQMLEFIPCELFDKLVKELKTDRYYKTFDTWTQFVTLLFGILSRCDSTTEIASGMQALQGKLSYLGLNASPAKSTIGDGIRNRDEEFFRLLYFALIDYFFQFLSVSRIKEVPFEHFYAFDSTTITLFTDIMKSVGRNLKGEGKKKGGLKVHMMIDVHSDTAKFACISEAKMHDKKFLQHLTLPKGSMIVFDKAYNHYAQFAKWTEEEVNFVCRLKDNALYEVQEVLFEQTLTEKSAGVMKVEHIHIEYKPAPNSKKKRKLCLRKVTYRDEQGRIYQFICNNFEISAEMIAFIYKKRWTIELLFKKLKQNFQLHYFYSETENGIKTQIWCTLIAQLLLTVLKVKTATKKAFSTVAALIRIHLISHLDMYWLIENCSRTYIKKTVKRNKSPGIQLTLPLY